MSIGSRRKEREISGICLFLVTHLNHKLTRAAYELRVWVRARAQLKTLSSLLKYVGPKGGGGGGGGLPYETDGDARRLA